ncbi:ATP-binding protein [Acidobacteriota bacterium]
MSFNDIHGNSRAKNILSKGLNRDRVPNSLLLIGPEGVGKAETALVLAKTLNCLNKKDDSCDECSNCRAINSWNFPDLHVLAPKDNHLRKRIEDEWGRGEVAVETEKKDLSSLAVENMRTLKQMAYLKPMVGRKRIFLIAEAETMRDEAANTLLKILEEPPAFTHLILISQNPYLILSTIKSRCQILTFSPVSREDIEKVLEGKGYEKSQAHLISLVVRGNLRKALNMNWEEIQAKRDLAWELFNALVRGENTADVVKNLSSSGGSFREEFAQSLEILSSFFRDLILIKNEGDPRFMLNPDYRDTIEGIAESMTFDHALSGLKRVDYAIYALQKKVNVNLLVSYLFSDLMEWNHV